MLNGERGLGHPPLPSPPPACALGVARRAGFLGHTWGRRSHTSRGADSCTKQPRPPRRHASLPEGDHREEAPRHWRGCSVVRRPSARWASPRPGRLPVALLDGHLLPPHTRCSSVLASACTTQLVGGGPPQSYDHLAMSRRRPASWGWSRITIEADSGTPARPAPRGGEEAALLVVQQIGRRGVSWWTDGGLASPASCPRSDGRVGLGSWVKVLLSRAQLKQTQLCLSRGLRERPVPCRTRKGTVIS